MVALSPTKLWAVEVPSTSYKYKISGTNWICCKHTPSFTTSFMPELKLEGKFQIVGTVTKDIIDFDCEPFLESHLVANCLMYKCYSGKYTETTNSNEAFRSLLSANELRFVNNELPPPYEVITEATKLIKEFPNDDLLKHSLEQSEHIKNVWQAAENALVQKLLILK